MKLVETESSGFSLVEVVIAAAIFTVVAAGLTSSIIISRKLAENVAHDNLALSVVQGYLEQLRTVEYNTLNDFASGDLSRLPLYSSNVLEDQEGEVSHISRDYYENGVRTKKELYVDVLDSTKSGRNKQIDLWLTPRVTTLKSANGNSLLVVVEYEYEVYRASGSELKSGEVRALVTQWD